MACGIGGPRGRRNGIPWDGRAALDKLAARDLPMAPMAPMAPMDVPPLAALVRPPSGLPPRRETGMSFYLPVYGHINGADQTPESGCTAEFSQGHRPVDRGIGQKEIIRGLSHSPSLPLGLCLSGLCTCADPRPRAPPKTARHRQGACNRVAWGKSMESKLSFIQLFTSSPSSPVQASPSPSKQSPCIPDDNPPPIPPRLSEGQLSWVY